mmetsp:Transcript_51128/g.145970  ORF Transcript_51128/g.145970 Transcript_51128/m.145970 type:complete len:200 (-) Transcript_51128:406-1005(-)
MQTFSAGSSLGHGASFRTCCSKSRSSRVVMVQTLCRRVSGILRLERARPSSSASRACRDASVSLERAQGPQTSSATRNQVSPSSMTSDGRAAHDVCSSRARKQRSATAQPQSLRSHPARPQPADIACRHAPAASAWLKPCAVSSEGQLSKPKASASRGLSHPAAAPASAPRAASAPPAVALRKRRMRSGVPGGARRSRS